MNISELIAPGRSAGVSLHGSNDVKEVELRRLAREFEALLLNQLTSSINPAQDENEESLFGSSSGMGLARQMFSEQMATAMAQNGGIGLADFIVNQLTQRAKGASATSADRIIAAARELRRNESQPNATTEFGEPIADSAIAGSKSNSTVSAFSEGKTVVQSIDVSRATRPRRVFPAKFNETPITDAAAVSSSARNSLVGPVDSRVNFLSPVQGVLRSVFGPRRDPINGRHRLHQGVDIAVPAGTPVGAAASGTVVFAGRNRGYGKMVMLEHADGRRTLYAHNQKLLVKVGDKVTAGQTIAAAGSTGHSTGPHVHFEVRENNRPINPLKFLSNVSKLTRR